MDKLRYIFLCVALLTMAGTLMAQDQVMFEYQGRVRVSGQPFQGEGRFKFAIMNTSATATLWSNDGTSDNGSQPSAYLEATVNDGVFTIMIGDTSLGMQSINSSIFQSRTPLRLRTWFSDGTHGFEQLNPDSKLVNISLITVATGETDFTIYVNGTTGNDANSGLAPDKAKKTIQAGVNAVPRHLLCNVTVKVAPGVYRETVDVSGISGSGIVFGNEVIGHRLILKGDESWTPASAGSPNVQITGCDEDVTSTPVRRFGILCHNNTTVEIEGFLVDRTSHSGIRCESGTYLLTDCKTADCTFSGVALWAGAFVTSNRVVSARNVHGFGLSASYMWLYDCIAENNTNTGVYANVNATAQVNSGTYRLNATGCAARDNAAVVFGTGGVVVQNNAMALRAYYQSYISNTSGVTFSGNTSYSEALYGGSIY